MTAPSTPHPPAPADRALTLDELANRNCEWSAASGRTRRALEIVRGLVTSTRPPASHAGMSASTSALLRCDHADAGLPPACPDSVEQAVWLGRAHGATGDGVPARICRALARAISDDADNLGDLLLFARAYLQRWDWGTWRCIYAVAVLLDSVQLRFIAREGLWREPGDDHRDIANHFSQAVVGLSAERRAVALDVIGIEFHPWLLEIAGEVAR